MRYVHFSRWLQGMVRGWGQDGEYNRVQLVAYEMPHLRGGAAATVLVGLQTRVEEFCAKFGIEYTPVHTATLKKATTGSGRGEKSAMYAALCKRGWHQPASDGTEVDDNEVDAICLLHYALAEIAVPAQRGAHDHP